VRRTKIVVTLGPVTTNENMVTKLINRGVNVFRLNFSHGDHEIHKKSIELIRSISAKLDKEVGILQDISGPKIRIGEVNIIDMVNVGEEVFFADGTLQSVVIDKDENSLTLKLLNDGELTSRKGVNFPKTKLN